MPVSIWAWEEWIADNFTPLCSWNSGPSWTKSGPYWDKCCPLNLLFFFSCYWHFFNFVFRNRFILFQSVISVFPLPFPLWSSSQSLCCNLPTNFVRLALGKDVFSSRDQYTHFCHRLMIYVKAQREHCSLTRNKLLPMPLSFLSIYSLPVLHYKLVLYLLGAININNIEIVFKNTPTFFLFFYKKLNIKCCKPATTWLFSEVALYVCLSVALSFIK